MRIRMIAIPSRVTKLIERIEAGDVPDAAELHRIAQLQALDIAKVGEDFVNERMAKEEQITQEYGAS